MEDVELDIDQTSNDSPFLARKNYYLGLGTSLAALATLQPTWQRTIGGRLAADRQTPLCLARAVALGLLLSADILEFEQLFSVLDQEVYQNQINFGDSGLDLETARQLYTKAVAHLKLCSGQALPNFVLDHGIDGLFAVPLASVLQLQKHASLLSNTIQPNLQEILPDCRVLQQGGKLSCWKEEKLLFEVAQQAQQLCVDMPSKEVQKTVVIDYKDQTRPEVSKQQHTDQAKLVLASRSKGRVKEQHYFAVISSLHSINNLLLKQKEDTRAFQMQLSRIRRASLIKQLRLNSLY